LFHAWLHQYHQPLYDSWDHCSTAELFAERGFAILGGHIRTKRLCGSYSLNPVLAEKLLPDFRLFTQTLVSLKRTQVKNWKAHNTALNSDAQITRAG
jgi:hypothetical protein